MRGFGLLRRVLGISPWPVLRLLRLGLRLWRLLLFLVLRVSLLSALVLLRRTLWRFRFRLVPGQRIEPIAWTSLRPGRGIRMTIEKRQAHARRGPSPAENIGTVP